MQDGSARAAFHFHESRLIDRLIRSADAIFAAGRFALGRHVAIARTLVGGRLIGGDHFAFQGVRIVFLGRVVDHAHRSAAIGAADALADERTARIQPCPTGGTDDHHALFGRILLFHVRNDRKKGGAARRRAATVALRKWLKANSFIIAAGRRKLQPQGTKARLRARPSLVRERGRRPPGRSI